MKVIKDHTQFKNYRLGIFILLIIFLFIIAPLFWFFILTKQRKSKPIINEKQGTQPLLNKNEYDDSQNSTGYSYSKLFQPCSNDLDDVGIGNLPEAFKPQKCDPNELLICTKNIYKGSICLSDLGGYCNTLNDCSPNADICLDNICSQSNNTLNNKCSNNDDCKIILKRNFNNTTAPIYNHVCINGRCKVNNYPYDSGCNSNKDCINDNSLCLNEIGKFPIIIDSGLSFYFEDSNIKWDDLNDMICQVTPPNNIYQITNWNGISGNLISSGTNSGDLNSGNYTISLGQEKLGICLEKIPEGGNSKIKLGGISIPCEDNLKDIDGYCLNNENSNLGEICVNEITKCKEYKDNNGKITNANCLYNYETEQILENNYYNNLIPNEFNIQKVGNCTIINSNKGEFCNNTINGCCFPYICISESNQNGNIINICNVPFQPEICVNEKCQKGYKCIDGLCKSLSNTICINNNDCVNNSCNNNRKFLKIYDPENSEIISTTEIKSKIYNTLPDKIFENLKYNIYKPNIENNLLATNIIIWSKFAYQENQIWLKIIKGEIEKEIFINYNSNQEIKDIIMDENEDIFIFYKNNINETMRRRTFPILNIDGNNFTLPNYNGLVDGIKVFYTNLGIGNIMVNKNILYTLKKTNANPNSSFHLEDDNGNTITLTNINLNNKNFIVTYDNKYQLYSGIENEFEKPYELIPEYNFLTTPQIPQLKTGDEVNFNNNNNTATLAYRNPWKNEDNEPGICYTQYIPDINKNYYITSISYGICGKNGDFNKKNLKFNTSEIKGNNNFNYIFSDEYYQANGGFPSLDNNKTFRQTYYPATGENELDLYITLNKNNFYTYSICGIDYSSILDGQEFSLNSQNYILETNNDYKINGINQGITYIYNDKNNDIEIKTKKIEDKNYMIINKGLSCNNGNGYLNQIIELEYSYENIKEGGYNYESNPFDINFINLLNLDQNNTKYKSHFKFNLDKTIVINESKGFYHSKNTLNKNRLDNITLNNDGSIFYTLKNIEELENNVENSIGLNNVYEKLEINEDTEYRPELEYSSFPNFPKLTPIEFGNINEYRKKIDGDNYFIIGTNELYINNQNDIDNILNFSSSELIISIKGKNISNSNYHINSNTPQLTFQLNEILEYNVTLEKEYLKIIVHTPFMESMLEIIESGNNWFLHPYNYISLTYFNFFQNQTNSFVYNINDSSLLFTSTKGTSFYENSNLELRRTGYNKIMIKNSGTNEDNGIPNIKNEYSVYNINDGAGIKLLKEGTSFFSNNNSYSEPKDYYDINSNVSFYESTNNPLNTDIITTLPTLMPYQNFLNGNENNYEILRGSSNGNYYESGIQDLNYFNSFGNGRFFINFIPLSNEQLIWLGPVSGKFDKNVFNYIPTPTKIVNGDYGYEPTEKEQIFNQYIISEDDILKDSGVIIRQINSGLIRLPYSGYDKEIYCINNLFLLPLGTKFLINNQNIANDYIVSNIKNNESINIGLIDLYQNYYPRYQTGTNQNPSFYNKSNKVSITWPEWIKTRYNNKTNEIPKIIKIIIDHSNGNTYGNSNYYAFVEFENKVSLVYLNNENNNFNLSENQGVPNTLSFYNNDFNVNDLDKFKMFSPKKFLYSLSNVCS